MTSFTIPHSIRPEAQTGRKPALSDCKDKALVLDFREVDVAYKAFGSNFGNRMTAWKDRQYNLTKKVRHGKS